jgi:hypothetical protein
MRLVDNSLPVRSTAYDSDKAGASPIETRSLLTFARFIPDRGPRPAGNDGADATG